MISTVERVLFLKAIDFFSGIQSELLVSVARLAVEIRFDRGERILSEGDDGDCLYLIVEGGVSIVYGGHPVAQLGPKQCVGEMSLLDGQPRSASVVADQATLCLRVDREPFYELLAEHPKLARGLISVLSQRVRLMLAEQRHTIV